ncbi:pre-mRNA-splicing factor CWC26 [Geosmithia morbida]|uniref:Pre-mRNA-splicing factor CWC26 n=1 Tax=Geosmithia morbida TaxID=1094350 RepID=A0A9P4Z0V5_9HYPO|nr:pre-mRNA-splicing factor CWC26 [Geosmithia morbida]KAF4125366.1 pre-mRNA-splicing factor CWC26 [Geosmithia morbida]
MAPDKADYLASRYLVADAKPTKKRKCKGGVAAPSQGLLITDDNDDSSWVKARDSDNDDNDAGPVTVTGTSSEFRKTKKSNWKSLSKDTSNRNSNNQNDEEASAADAILASVAAETRLRSQDDEAPVIEGEDGTSSSVKMSDGTHAGLQSAAAVSAQLKRRQREEREDFERHRQNAQEAETVYRDATGRRVDISMKRAEARKAAAEAEEKERQAKEALKGDVQQEEARRRREQLDDAKLMTFARGVDDEDMNRELKNQQRWNDPMTQFMTADEAKSSSEGKKKKGAKGCRPVYNGAAPPNRYGIKPGYRWDGVDRGNGFEAERFRAINRREMNKGLSYSWQMDE